MSESSVPERVPARSWSTSPGGFRAGDAVVAVLSVLVEGSGRAVYIAVDPCKLGRWAAAEVE